MISDFHPAGWIEQNDGAASCWHEMHKLMLLLDHHPRAGGGDLDVPLGLLPWTTDPPSLFGDDLVSKQVSSCESHITAAEAQGRS